MREGAPSHVERANLGSSTGLFPPPAELDEMLYEFNKQHPDEFVYSRRQLGAAAEARRRAALDDGCIQVPDLCVAGEAIALRIAAER